MEQLEKVHPQTYWSQLPSANAPGSMILDINQNNPLSLIREADIRDRGAHSLT